MTQTTVDDGVVAELRQQIFGDDITADQLAAVLDLDKSTVLRYLRDGEIIGYQMGRTWYAPKSGIAAYRRKLIERQKQRVAIAEGRMSETPPPEVDDLDTHYSVETTRTSVNPSDASDGKAR